MPIGSRALLPALLGLTALTLFIVVKENIDALSSLWSAVLIEVQIIQRTLHRQLAAAVQAIHQQGGVAFWGLAGLGFLYGVFHAVGPGHGKVVISTYILTQESQLKRGIALSMLSSLAQGITAIVLVQTTIGVLGLTMRQAQSGSQTLELVSYGLVAVIGVVLIFTRGRNLLRRVRKGPPARSHHDHDHEHQQVHRNGHGHHNHNHNHNHNHEHASACSHCGHAHGPTRDQLDAPMSLRGLAAIILSIGIRPCSGGILVLLAAHAMNLPWAGIAAVLAMSIGTGLSVSALATLSVYARKLSLQIAAAMPGQRSWFGAGLDSVGVIGGVIILLAGLLLLQSAWVMTTHPLLR